MEYVNKVSMVTNANHVNVLLQTPATTLQIRVVLLSQPLHLCVDAKLDMLVAVVRNALMGTLESQRNEMESVNSVCAVEILISD